MYIGKIMHTNLVTVAPNASLFDADKLIRDNPIDHLLVVNKKDKLVGIISDRDLKKYWASPATSLSKHELAYLLEKVVHVEIVIEVALIAIARKVIILDVEKYSHLTVMGIAALILALAVAIYAIKRMLKSENSTS